MEQDNLAVAGFLILEVSALRDPVFILLVDKSVIVLSSIACCTRLFSLISPLVHLLLYPPSFLSETLL